MHDPKQAFLPLGHGGLGPLSIIRRQSSEMCISRLHPEGNGRICCVGGDLDLCPFHGLPSVALTEIFRTEVANPCLRLHTYLRTDIFLPSWAPFRFLASQRFTSH